MSLLDWSRLQRMLHQGLSHVAGIVELVDLIVERRQSKEESIPTPPMADSERDHVCVDTAAIIEIEHWVRQARDHVERPSDALGEIACIIERARGLEQFSVWPNAWKPKMPEDDNGTSAWIRSGLLSRVLYVLFDNARDNEPLRQEMLDVYNRLAGTEATDLRQELGQEPFIFGACAATKLANLLFSMRRGATDTLIAAMRFIAEVHNVDLEQLVRSIPDVDAVFKDASALKEQSEQLGQRLKEVENSAKVVEETCAAHRARIIELEAMAKSQPAPTQGEEALRLRVGQLSATLARVYSESEVGSLDRAHLMRAYSQETGRMPGDLLDELKCERLSPDAALVAKLSNVLGYATTQGQSMGALVGVALQHIASAYGRSSAELLDLVPGFVEMRKQVAAASETSAKPLSEEHAALIRAWDEGPSHVAVLNAVCGMLVVRRGASRTGVLRRFLRDTPEYYEMQARIKKLAETLLYSLLNLPNGKERELLVSTYRLVVVNPEADPVDEIRRDIEGCD